MREYLGFDLGDAESAVAELSEQAGEEPRIVPVRGEESFVSALARTADGRILIGEEACLSSDAAERFVSFKSRFLKERAADRAIRSFAGAVWAELAGAEGKGDRQQALVYVGCPAGWTPNDRERYRALFEEAGFPPLRIVSESRAAMVSACQSRHLQVGYEILKKSVLVIDIGSSTTDFAYVQGGKERALLTGGEVFLGGGAMDEILLHESVEESASREEIRAFLQAHESWRSYCLFAARKLKERYFSDEDYWSERRLSQRVVLPGQHRLSFSIALDRERAGRLLGAPAEGLSGRSFGEAFGESLEGAARAMGETPDLVFLTGGVSRIAQIGEWCRERFPASVLITAKDPAFSVARGLAWCGRIDADLQRFREEVDELITGELVEETVKAYLPDLYHRAVETLTEPILTRCCLPVFERWRNGEIPRLVDVDREMERETEKFLRSPEARDLLQGSVTEWMRPIARRLEEVTKPICIAHRIPYRAMSLTSFMELSGAGVGLEARSVLRVEEMTLLIDTIISILVGLLCGGSGVALLSAGIPGIAAGVSISLLVLLLGKKRMEGAILRADIPRPLRRLVGRGYFTNRLESIEREVEERFFAELMEEEGERHMEEMTKDISGQIEQCLFRMAEVVEIPLGS